MKKILNYFVVIFTVLVAISCNSIDKSKITVIDNIVLGQSDVAFFRSLDSIGLNEEIFNSECTFYDYEDVAIKRLKLRYTKQFNYPDFSSKNNQHYGILHPTINDAFNIIELNVLFVHTSPTIMIGNSGITNISQLTGINCYIQNMRVDLIDKIQGDLTLKYGNPKEILTSTENMFFVMEENYISKYKDGEFKNDIIVWETDELNIYLFKGIEKSTSICTKSGIRANTYLEGFGLVAPDYSDTSQIPCRSFPYIKYALKPEIIKKLKLDIKKI